MSNDATTATFVSLDWDEDYAAEASVHSDYAKRVVERLQAKGAEIFEVHVENWHATGERFFPGGRAKNWTHKVHAQACVISFDIDGFAGAVVVTQTRLGNAGAVRSRTLTVGAHYTATLEGNIWSESASQWRARGYSRGHYVTMALAEHPDAKGIRQALGMK